MQFSHGYMIKLRVNYRKIGTVVGIGVVMTLISLASFAYGYETEQRHQDVMTRTTPIPTPTESFIPWMTPVPWITCEDVERETDYPVCFLWADGLEICASEDSEPTGENPGCYWPRGRCGYAFVRLPEPWSETLPLTFTPESDRKRCKP